MKNPNHTNRRGFSLIELLVVIVIIASLAALSYGPIMKVVTDSRIESGNKIANDLVFAVEQFEQKYDYLPYTPNRSAVEDSDDDQSFSSRGDLVEYRGAHFVELLQILMGKEGSNPEVNTTNQQFFDYKAAKSGVNGILFSEDGETPAGLRDPFGNDFVLIIDYSGDNEIDLAGSSFRGHTDKNGSPQVIRRVAVAGAQGPDREFYTGNNDNDDVTSF